MMKQVIKDIAQMMHQADPTSCFSVEFWDGDAICFGNSPRVTLRLKTKKCAQNIIEKGFLGLGESYTNGDLEIENDLRELFHLGFAINFDDYRLPVRQKCRLFIRSLLNRATLRGAPQNIAYHYDRGNEFYALYLDKTMTYSCAYFKSPDDSLEQAQLNKYEHIARKLLLKPNESLLDIGCGWGGMLIYAAQKYGITGTGNTLSQNQYEYVQRKIKELGLCDRIKVLCQDYRQLSGKFDKVVSIGMFEHVGKNFIPAFFRKVSGLLKTGGLGLLHTIGKDAPTIDDPWTFKYIFPGAYLPTLSEITHEIGKIGFSVLDVENLRLHYAKTLEKWAENYERNITRARELFDDEFIRRWRLFFNSAAAGFRYGNSRLFQILFSNGLNNALPITRTHVYHEPSP
ncbi:MAG: cyclopropane-fatty-acyl-phospholipid synthase family protein [Pseudomonadota bacterium]